MGHDLDDEEYKATRKLLQVDNVSHFIGKCNLCRQDVFNWEYYEVVTSKTGKHFVHRKCINKLKRKKE